MRWGLFLWHKFGSLMPIGHFLNDTIYLSIVTDHMSPFMDTVYLLYNSYVTTVMHLVTQHQSSYEHDNEVGVQYISKV